MANSMHTWSILGCVGLVLLVARADTLFAQPSSEPASVTYWLSTGLGLSSLGALAGNAGGSIQFGRGLVSLRATANSEAILGGDELFDFGLLFGLASRSTAWHASVAAGVAGVTGSRGDLSIFGGGKRVGIDPVIGLPFEAQLFRKFGNIFGLGVYGFANINREQSFGGINVTIRLGKLR